MKKLMYTLLIAACFLAGCASGAYTSAGVDAGYQTNTGARLSVGYETFYNELAPYGRWVDYPGEGYMWIPGAETGFRPYATNGHWIYTNYGWTWASNYSWGWAPFHYGRWMYDNGYGWMWLPGHEWAPAWVTWGQSGGYYGWAPLAPHISINVSIGGGWTPPQHYWNFVPAEHITRENINAYVVNNTSNTTVINNITKNVTIINNNSAIHSNDIPNNSLHNNGAVYNKGPMIGDVERVTNNRVQPVVIREGARPGTPSLSNNELPVYHPVGKQYSERAIVPKPAVQRHDVPPIEQKRVQGFPQNDRQQYAPADRPVMYDNRHQPPPASYEPANQRKEKQQLISPAPAPGKNPVSF